MKSDLSCFWDWGFVLCGFSSFLWEKNLNLLELLLGGFFWKKWSMLFFSSFIPFGVCSLYWLVSCSFAFPFFQMNLARSVFLCQMNLWVGWIKWTWLFLRFIWLFLYCTKSLLNVLLNEMIAQGSFNILVFFSSFKKESRYFHFIWIFDVFVSFGYWNEAWVRSID